ncbi:hypothetical protein PIIN_11411 [Serendipita indica DSM 11827]|uniref:Uncharacterized protein n=1 Tax=Serendipita indica (strain DSM 11827) TaxID=1109443 RepID=G4U1J1_SERID|nr:hypothetical protein PIIN_11411 [Serendipita indica DSM 11827]
MPEDSGIDDGYSLDETNVDAPRITVERFRGIPVQARQA